MPGRRAHGPTQRHLFLNNQFSKKHNVLKTHVYRCLQQVGWRSAGGRGVRAGWRECAGESDDEGRARNSFELLVIKPLRGTCNVHAHVCLYLHLVDKDIATR